ncbi:unnamed protein product [Closterium sp. Naga37s-1]|nr:unnamed protein product [Closterium sp. Naga37s-1]
MGEGYFISPSPIPFPPQLHPPPSSPCPQRDNGPWETLPAVTTIALGNANYYGGGMKNKDPGPWETLPAVTTIAVGNANFYGEGMKICPHANPCSGSQDVRLGLRGAGIDGGQGGHR